MSTPAFTDLRGYIARLREQGDLIEISEPMSLQYEIGALCRVLADRDGPAALLTNIAGNTSPAKVAAVNIYGPRRRIASAFGVDEAGLLGFVAERIKKRIAPERITRPGRYYAA